MKIDISNDLKKLGIQEVNNGICTGTKWKETRAGFIESFSPSDGEKIAGVNQASAADYREVITTAKKAVYPGDVFL